MHKHLHVGITCVALLLASFIPFSARAGTTIGREIWIGGGVSWPVYHDVAMACIRGGFGAVFLEHVTLGISGQADRDRIHYFVDAGLILPHIGDLEPYGRFQVGRRDDRDDTAKGWAVGVRMGDPGGGAVSFYLEGHGIFEPEEDNGVSVGISF